MSSIPDRFPDPDFDPPQGGAFASIVLAGGCFWCTEGVFRQVPGVIDVVSGYAGGDPKRAGYRDVCQGDTGHAEAIRVDYDPRKISLGQILKVFFWLAHDPTQIDRQGNDVGPQYRSAVFYADDAQRAVAQQYIAQIDAARVFEKRVATRLEPLETFFRAEDEHQNYAARNPEQGYIMAVAAPKIARTRKLLG